jgi:hypothetical protein
MIDRRDQGKSFEDDWREFLCSREERRTAQAADLEPYKEASRKLTAMEEQIKALLPAESRGLMVELSDLYTELMGILSMSVFDHGMRDGIRVMRVLGQ